MEVVGVGDDLLYRLSDDEAHLLGLMAATLWVEMRLIGCRSACDVQTLFVCMFDVDLFALKSKN